MSSPPQKKYKLWATDKNKSIPVSTLQRWEKTGRYPANISRIMVDKFGVNSDGAEKMETLHVGRNESILADGENEENVNGGGNEVSLYGSGQNSQDNSISNSDDDSNSSDDDDSYIGVDPRCDNAMNDLDDKSFDFAATSDNDVDSEDEVDESPTNPLEKNMLYEGCEKTVDESVLDIMTIYLEQNCTKNTLMKMLQSIHGMLPKKNGLPKTVYKLFKYVEDSGPKCPTVTHYACKNKKCGRYLGIDRSTKCRGCSGEMGQSVFYEIDIAYQIKHMFEHRNLAEKLKPISIRDDNLITDINDGSEYLRVRTEMDLQEYDLTLILNTDGLSLVKSKGTQCWPLMFTIAEVKEHLRESFLIMAGIWFDEKNKPLMNTFLQPFCLKIVEYYNTGISWTNAKTNENCISKIVCPLIVADAPARCQVQNVMQYNGRYGCGICEIKSRRCIRISGVKSVRIYPFGSEMSMLRSKARMESQALRAVNDGKNHVKGVKGPTVISILPGLDPSTCMSSEFLHLVLLGIGKQFLCLWLTKKGPWNISAFIKEIDTELMNIRPPQSFSRLPRSLSEFLSYKGHEFLNWILYYSVPILRKYLETEYFDHWLLLVRALFILLQTKIDRNSDLRISNILLRMFVRDIDILYGDRNLTSITHQLLHLSLCVERWGPLWATAAFVFENYNGMIAQLVHGSKHQGQELINKLRIIMGVQILRNRVHGESVDENVLDGGKNNCIIGKNIEMKVTDKEKRLLELRFINESNSMAYSRAKIRGEIFTSEFYKKIKTNSFTVKVIDSHNSIQYGTIRCFFLKRNDIYFILKCFAVDEANRIYYGEDLEIGIPHIIPIHEQDEFLIMNLKEVRSVSQVIRVENFICERPNLLRKIL